MLQNALFVIYCINFYCENNNQIKHNVRYGTFLKICTGDIMDRRQQKTRTAIFKAFGTLLGHKNYNNITVQEIIDEANIGRSTFYAHFETKDDLLKELCKELFGHIIDSAIDCSHTHGLYSDNSVPNSVFCHLLQHLEENNNNVLGLLSCESSEIFLRYFKDSLNELVQTQFVNQRREKNILLPNDFLINHISSSFVEMILWWIKGHRKQSPTELDQYFRAVIEPIL
jgi:Transcriptional regulator